MEVFRTEIFRTDWIEYKGERLKRQEVIKNGKITRLDWRAYRGRTEENYLQWEFIENHKEIEAYYQSNKS